MDMDELFRGCQPHPHKQTNMVYGQLQQKTLTQLRYSVSIPKEEEIRNGD